jgi:L-erythrulose 1-phosphate isomerase
MKKNFYIGTSWKMYKTASEGAEYLRQLKNGLPDLPHCQVFVAVPFTALWKAVEATQGSPVLVGAQNMHWADEGAYTGEVSPKMLKETGIQLVELAHSERRTYYNENDQEVNKKVKAALAHGLIPLVCVGERASDKSYGVSADFLSMQLRIALYGLTPGQAERVWIAYEPVWAIGEGGRPAEPAYADAMQAHMREVLRDLFGPHSGQAIPILYGGSVNQENALELARQPNIDGLFIGRAAWSVDSFLRIIRDVSALTGAEKN